MNFRDIVPGGSHTYSKSDDCFPANAPKYLVKGEGCCVTDDCGIEYIDWAMGLRSVILGHSYPAVDKAVINAVKAGTNMCRPTLYEEELANLLIDNIPSAEMVKFGKSGSDATSAAIKLARAYTGKFKILVAKENPFISQHDWYIGTKPTNAGIPYAGTYMSNVDAFDYNTMEYRGLPLRTAAKHFKDVAAIVLDPSTVDITKEKMQYLRDICTENEIVFILDEIISGFRYGISGVQGIFEVIPDLSTFGKSIANGYSVSALCGKRKIMQLGDRRYGDVFLLSGTYNAETPALAAAIATIKEISKGRVTRRINLTGKHLTEQISKTISKYNLDEYINIKSFSIDGDIIGSNPMMGFKNMTIKTIFDQCMIEQGIIMPYIAPSFSHTSVKLSRTLEAVTLSVQVVSEAIRDGNLSSYLIKGWEEKPVFRKCNLIEK
jgi:glutamate-1-semialdehyde 2,1-aminomutase